MAIGSEVKSLHCAATVESDTTQSKSRAGAMIYHESLPYHGFGSPGWFDKVFNFANERNKALKVLADGFGPIPVLKMLERQVTTFLTEWGVGREALQIQPPTNYIVKHTSTGLQVFAESITEYGEQLSGYLNFNQMPSIIADNLAAGFEELFDLNEGEGIVHYSGNEFYKKNYESTSDVINPLVLKEKIYDENGDIEELHVTGWFLFLNRVLSPEERQFWLECHSTESVELNKITAEYLISHSQYWQVDPYLDPNEETAAAKEYINWLNMAFIDRFGKPLFKTAKENNLRANIYSTVQQEANLLLHMLLGNQKIPLFEKLWQLMQQGQKKWAELMNIDFDWYWSQIMLGKLQVMGFHPTDGSELSQYWDPIFHDWIGGTYDCSENNFKKHCEEHGSYSGNECPKCKNKK